MCWVNSSSSKSFNFLVLQGARICVSFFSLASSSSNSSTISNNLFQNIHDKWHKIHFPSMTIISLLNHNLLTHLYETVINVHLLHNISSTKLFYNLLNLFVIWIQPRKISETYPNTHRYHSLQMSHSTLVINDKYI